MSSRPSARWRWPRRSRNCRRRMSSKSKTEHRQLLRGLPVGQEIRHATPRTLTEADAALNIGLYGSRFAINSSDVFARALGLPRAPLDDLLVFHVVIGKTVPDISLNAVANLGYAEFRWGVPVYPGDTLSVRSTVLGLRENSNRASGVVWVRSTGINQRGEMVLDYVRWVMVHKRDHAADVGAPVVPKTAPSVAPADLIVPRTSSMMRLRRRGGRLAASLGGLRAGRAHRPCERHHARGLRPHVLDAALPEHRAGPFRRLRRQEHALRPAPGLWRPCHFAGPGAVVQRPRPTASAWRPSTAAAMSRRPSAATRSMPGRKCWKRRALPRRSDIGALRVRTIAAKDCPCSDLAGQGRRRQIPSRGRARPRLLAADARRSEFRLRNPRLNACGDFIDLKRRGKKQPSALEVLRDERRQSAGPSAAFSRICRSTSRSSPRSCRSCTAPPASRCRSARSISRLWVICAASSPRPTRTFQSFNTSIVGPHRAGRLAVLRLLSPVQRHPAPVLGCGLRLRAQGRLSQRLDRRRRRRWSPRSCRGSSASG